VRSVAEEIILCRVAKMQGMSGPGRGCESDDLDDEPYRSPTSRWICDLRKARLLLVGSSRQKVSLSEQEKPSAI